MDPSLAVSGITGITRCNPVFKIVLSIVKSLPSWTLQPILPLLMAFLDQEDKDKVLVIVKNKRITDKMDCDLYCAAKCGDLDFLQDEANKPNKHDRVSKQKTPKENTVLHVAAEFGQKEFIEVIVYQYPDLFPFLLSVKNKMGDTPLHIAARSGHVEVIKYILAIFATSENKMLYHKLLGSKNSKNVTAFYEAVRNGHLEIVKLMIITADHDSFSGSYGRHGLTALHASVIHNYPDITTLLLEKNLDLVDMEDQIGRTPLYYAAKFGYVDTVQQLLKQYKKAAYFLDKDGWSPLHAAACEGHKDVIAEILQRCPDTIEILNRDGHNALQVAACFGQKDVVSYFLQFRDYDGLIKETDIHGNTLLYLASINDQKEVVEIILQDRRLNARGLSEDSCTALDTAEYKANRAKNLERVRTKDVLVSGGAKLDTIQLIESGNKNLKDRGDDRDTWGNKRNPDIQLLVATLVATVTFTAGLTMPGGYTSKGAANLADKAAFKAFLVSDAIAFFLSLGVIMIQFLATFSNGFNSRPYTMMFSAEYMLVALVGMVIAFISGVYVVLGDSIGLAVAVCVIGGCCYIFMIMRERVSKSASKRKRRVSKHMRFQEILPLGLNCV